MTDCPKGEQCDSMMICHYERFSHKLLAKKRYVSVETVSLDEALCEANSDNDDSCEDFQEPLSSRTQQSASCSLENSGQYETEPASSLERNAPEENTPSTKKKLKLSPVPQSLPCPFVKLEPTSPTVYSTNKNSETTDDSESWPKLEPVSPGFFLKVEPDSLWDANAGENNASVTTDEFLKVVSSAANFQGCSSELDISNTVPDESMPFEATSTQLSQGGDDDTEPKSDNESFDDLPSISFRKTNKRNVYESSETTSSVARNDSSLSSPIRTTVGQFQNVKLNTSPNTIQISNVISKTKQGDVGSLLFGLKPLKESLNYTASGEHIPIVLVW